MVEIVRNREAEADAFIREFSDKFYGKFGIRPRVTYSYKGNLNKVRLQDLEDAVNHIMHCDYDVDVIDATIRTKLRNRILVIYRQCTFKIAHDLGYNWTNIGKHFGYNHATIMYSFKNINNLITCSDKEVIKVLSKIENELQERFGTDRDAKPDPETRIDS